MRVSVEWILCQLLILYFVRHRMHNVCVNEREREREEKKEVQNFYSYVCVDLPFTKRTRERDE